MIAGEGAGAPILRRRAGTSELQMRHPLLALALLLSACATGSGAVGDAVVNSAVALVSSGASRASGNCYASCPNGTQCNHGTGYCDPIPCEGKCIGDQV